MLTDAEVAEHAARGRFGPAGHCCDCGEVIWRTVEHPTLGRTILWPDPSSVYAKVWSDIGVAVGIGYCADCCPNLGTDAHPGIRVESRVGKAPVQRHACSVVIGHETAARRYAYWYTPGYGEWLRAWLAQECRLPEAEVAQKMDQWLADVKAARG